MRLRDIENTGNRTLSAIFDSIGPAFDALTPWVAIFAITVLPVVAFAMVMAMLMGHRIG